MAVAQKANDVHREHTTYAIISVMTKKICDDSERYESTEERLQ